MVYVHTKGCSLHDWVQEHVLVTGRTSYYDAGTLLSRVAPVMRGILRYVILICLYTKGCSLHSVQEHVLVTGGVCYSLCGMFRRGLATPPGPLGSWHNIPFLYRILYHIVYDISDILLHLLLPRRVMTMLMKTIMMILIFEW